MILFVLAAVLILSEVAEEVLFAGRLGELGQAALQGQIPLGGRQGGNTKRQLLLFSTRQFSC